ncbi:MAG: LON peptidase substrate-binding domain-containing protein [Alphaproteobacteria bacterium]
MKRFRTLQDMPATAPVFPLPGVLLLPRARLPLNIFEPRYLQMIEDALASPDRMIVMVQPQDAEADLTPDADPQPDLHHIGTAGRIVSFIESDDGRYIINLLGIARVSLVDECPRQRLYREFRADFTDFGDDLTTPPDAEAMNREGLLDAVRRFSERHDLAMDWDALNKTPNEQLVNSLSMISPYGPREKQALLEAQTISERADLLIALTEMWLAATDQGDNGPSGPLQ